MATEHDPVGELERIELRRTQAFELRLAGASTRAIASRLHVSHVTIAKDIKTVLAKLAEEQLANAAELRTLELERLDVAMLGIANSVKAGNLGAIDRWIRLSDARCRLLGLVRDRLDITSGGERVKGYIGISPDDWDTPQGIEQTLDKTPEVGTEPAIAD